MATWDVSKWDEGVWDADPSHARAAGGGAKRRRPNEKIVWYDDWLKSQQKNDVPEEEQTEDIEEAIEVVKAYKEKVVSTVDAKAAILKAKNAQDMLNQVRELKILMETYFAIQQEKLRVKKQDDDFVSMFMLGVL